LAATSGGAIHGVAVVIIETLTGARTGSLLGATGTTLVGTHVGVATRDAPFNAVVIIIAVVVISIRRSPERSWATHVLWSVGETWRWSRTTKDSTVAGSRVGTQCIEPLRE
jgi:hypothetical protein